MDDTFDMDLRVFAIGLPVMRAGVVLRRVPATAVLPVPDNLG